MKKIAFHIQKGGVGKTSLSGNVASCAARFKNTVLIDADPQGNASSWFLTEQPPYELADVLSGKCTAAEAVVRTSSGLSLIPTFGLDGTLKQYAETHLNDEPFIFEDLSAELDRLGYEVAIFDLSPGMSRLEKCLLIAVDEVVTPLTPEYFSLDGIAIFRNELQKLNRNFRRSIRHTKVVCTMLNRSFKRHQLFYEEFRRLELSLFTIAQDAKVAECQIANRSLFEYCPESKVVAELESLTRSLLEIADGAETNLT